MAQDRTKKTKAFHILLIAPCGMNCRLCKAYMRDKNACPGCRGADSLKPKTRIYCSIKKCVKRARGKFKYCFACDSFPCQKLRHLDIRYKTKYGMSMIENLNMIREFGIRHFINREREKWVCPECGRVICVHEPQCLFCKHPWHISRGPYDISREHIPSL